LRDALVEAEYVLAFYDVVKFMVDDLRLDRGREKLHEALQLLLTLQRTLVRNDKISHLVLELRRQFQILDGRVDLRQLLLEVCLLEVKLTHQHGKLTKDVSVDDGSEEQAHAAEEDLEGVTRSNIIASGKQHGRMKSHEVLVNNALLVHVVEVSVVVVHRRDPVRLVGHDDPPNAREAMQVHDQQEDQL